MIHESEAEVEYFKESTFPNQFRLLFEMNHQLTWIHLAA